MDPSVEVFQVIEHRYRIIAYIRKNRFGHLNFDFFPENILLFVVVH